MRRLIRAVSVKFRPGTRKIHKMARIAVSTMYSSLWGLPDLADDFPIIEDEIVEENDLKNLRDLTSMNDHGPSTWQCI